MGKPLSLIGNEYGSLVVIKDLGTTHGITKRKVSYFLCRCKICGFEKPIGGSNLKSGNIQSCGNRSCSPLHKDLTSRTFGFLTVVRRIVDPEQKISYECECVCGNEKIVPCAYLLSGDVKSCGCNGKIFEEMQFKHLYNTHKKNSKRRRIEFIIGYEVFKKLIRSPCSYCGVLYGSEITKGENFFRYIGLDRVDNGIGYTSENTVPCCVPCNRMKSTFTLEEFKNHLLKILRHCNLS